MLRSKLKKKLPAIKFLGKLNQPQDIQELFKPVITLNFDEEEEEDINCNREQWKGKHGERFRKKYTENKKLMSKLTTDYKSAILEVRKEMKKGRAFLSETIDDLKVIMSKSRKIKADDLLPMKVEDPIEIDDYLENQQPEQVQEDSTSWILLRAHCGERDYQVSTEGYGQEESDQLLNRPHVEWSVLNESVMKCHEWFKRIEIN